MSTTFFPRVARVFVAVLLAAGLLNLPAPVTAQEQEPTPAASAEPAPAPQPAATPQPSPTPTPAPDPSPASTATPAPAAEPAPSADGGADGGAAGDPATSSGAAEVAPPDPCRDVDCQAIVDQLLEIQIAVPCSSSAGVDCAGLVEDVLALIADTCADSSCIDVIEIRDPCVTVDCDELIENAQDVLAEDPCYRIDCDSLVSTVVGLVNTEGCLERAAAIDCASVLRTIQRTIDSACESGYGSGADACINLAAEVVADAVASALNVLCPGYSGSAGMCAGEVSERVNDLIADGINLVCSSRYSSGADACVDMATQVVDDAIETAFDVACPDSGSAAASCANDVVERASSLVVGVCSGAIATAGSGPLDGSARAAATHPCVDRAMSLVSYALTVACGSDDAVECVNRLADRVDTLVTGVCSNQITMATSAASFEQACVETVVDLVDYAMRAACGTADEVTCVNNLADRVDTLVTGVCTNQITLATSAMAFEQACVEKVLDLVDYALRTACGTGDAVTCVNNLADRVDTLVTGVCTNQITLATSAMAFEQACVDKVVDLVDYAMRTACGTGDAVTCVNNLLDRVDTVVTGICTNQITLATSAMAFEQACVDKLLDVVDFAMTTACQSDDALTCANNLVDRVDGLVTGLCTGGITTATTAAGTIDHACADRVLTIVDYAMKTACQSGDALVCANNLIDRVDGLVTGACSGGITTATTAAGTIDQACAERVFLLIDTVLTTMCGSTDAATCADDVLRVVDDVLDGACTGSATEAQAGASCVEDVVGVVYTILAGVCPGGDAAACTSVLGTVLQIVEEACAGATTGGDAASLSCTRDVVAQVEQVVHAACHSISADDPAAAAGCAGAAVSALAALLNEYVYVDGTSLLGFEVKPREFYPAGPRPTSTQISAVVAGPGFEIRITDHAGGLVRVFGNLAPVSTVSWDGRDSAGNVVPNGPYLITLTAPGDELTEPARESAWVMVGGGPAISGLSAHTVSIGQELTIYGSGFTTGVGAYGVTIGDEPAEVVSWSNSAVTVAVPTSIEAGQHDVVLSAADLDSRPGSVRVVNYVPAPPPSELVPGTVNIRVKPGASATTIAAQYGDTLVTPIFAGETDSLLSRWYSVSVPIGTEATKILTYANNPQVEWAEANGVVSSTATPNDPRFGRQWHLNYSNDKDIDAPQAWEVTKGTSSVSIAIIDSGVAAGHEDLSNQVLGSRDYTGTGGGDGCAGHRFSHGTHVAGIAAADTNNGKGVAGVGWNTKLRSYKVLRGADCTGSKADTARAINDASKADNEIINLSLGDDDPYALERDAVKKAWERGVVIVAAAGNHGTRALHYPAAYANVLSVGALTYTGAKRDSSAHGDWVDVFAPGESIYSTYRTSGGNNTYEYGSGTSMASPVVAGIAALMKAKEPNAANSTIVAALKQAVRGVNNKRINAVTALREILRIKQPNGVFARVEGTSRVYFVDDGVKRLVKTARVLASWGVASPNGEQVAVLTEEQMKDIPRGSDLGFRPGTLIRPEDDPSVTYAITNDSPTSGQGWTDGRKRPISVASFACLGYQEEDVVLVKQGELNLHPTGTEVTGCDRHPNGAIVRDLSLNVWVLHKGAKRLVRNDKILASWGMTDEVIEPTPLSDTELQSLPDGAVLGFRPGRIIRFPESPLFLVTSSGGDFARGKKRPFSGGRAAFPCYGLQRANVTSVSRSDAQLHDNADNLPC